MRADLLRIIEDLDKEFGFALYFDTRYPESLRMVATGVHDFCKFISPDMKPEILDHQLQGFQLARKSLPSYGDPKEFWDGERSDCCCALRPIAFAALALTPTTVACERDFSWLGAVARKARNRLTAGSLADMQVIASSERRGPADVVPDGPASDSDVNDGSSYSETSSEGDQELADDESLSSGSTESSVVEITSSEASESSTSSETSSEGDSSSDEDDSDFGTRDRRRAKQKRLPDGKCQPLKTRRKR